MPAASNKELTLKRRLLAWEMHLKGATCPEIVTAFKDAGLGEITRQGVYNMVRSLEDQANAELRDEMKGEKKRQVQRLRMLYAEAIRAWEESKKPTKETTVRHVQTKDGPVASDPVVRVKHNPAGDPRHFQNAMKALEDIRKTLGLEAAAKLTIGLPDEEELNKYEEARQSDLAKLSAAELGLIAALYRKAELLGRGEEVPPDLLHEIMGSRASVLLPDPTAVIVVATPEPEATASMPQPLGPVAVEPVPTPEPAPAPTEGSEKIDIAALLMGPQEADLKKAKAFLEWVRQQTGRMNHEELRQFWTEEMLQKKREADRRVHDSERAAGDGDDALKRKLREAGLRP